MIKITHKGRVKDRNNFEVRGRGGWQFCIDKSEQRITLHGSPNFVSFSTTFVPDCREFIVGYFILVSFLECATITNLITLDQIFSKLS